MISKDQIREIAFKRGVDLFGVAPVERFENAPEGFHPRDIYSKTETVFVFAIKLLAETLYADNPVPFSHMNTLAMQKMDANSFVSVNKKSLQSR